MTDSGSQSAPDRRKPRHTFSPLDPELLEKMNQQSEGVRDLIDKVTAAAEAAGVTETLASAERAMRHEPPVIHVRQLPPSPATKAAVNTASTMRQVELLMGRQLDIARSTQDALVAAQVETAKSAKFTRGMAWASFWVAVASLGAAVASVILTLVLR